MGYIYIFVLLVVNYLFLNRDNYRSYYNGLYLYEIIYINYIEDSFFLNDLLIFR